MTKKKTNFTTIFSRKEHVTIVLSGSLYKDIPVLKMIEKYDIMNLFFYSKVNEKLYQHLFPKMKHTQALTRKDGVYILLKNEKVEHQNIILSRTFSNIKINNGDLKRNIDDLLSSFYLCNKIEKKKHCKTDLKNVFVFPDIIFPFIRQQNVHIERSSKLENLIPYLNENFCIYTCSYKILFLCKSMSYHSKKVPLWDFFRNFICKNNMRDKNTCNVN